MALIRENSDSRNTGSLNKCSHWCLYQMQEYFPIVLPTYIKWQVYFSIVHTLINDKCIFSFIFLGKNQRSNKIYWIIDINTISHLLQSCKLRNEELMTWNDEVIISGTYLYICLTKISKWPWIEYEWFCLTAADYLNLGLIWKQAGKFVERKKNKRLWMGFESTTYFVITIQVH